VFSTQDVAVTNAPHVLSFYGTGSIALTGTASPEVSLVGTGAYTRVSLLFTPSAGTLTLTASGLVWLAQLEIGAHATSYITTGATTAARAADSCSTTTLSPWFDEETGTIYCEYMTPWADNAAETATRFCALVNDGTDDNRHAVGLLYEGNQYAATTAGGTTQASLSAGAFSANTIHKLAYAWAANDCAMYASGGGSGTDTSATMPTGLTTFLIGSAGGGPNGYIRKVKFYPRRLSNAELAALVA
jgi:hypothetical protein